jgi:exonuclease SbcC
MLTNFKTKKQNSLAEINSKGTNLNTEKASLETELKGLKERIKTGTDSIENFKTEIKTIEGSIEVETSKTTATATIDKDSLVRESLIKNSDYQSKLQELATLEVTIEDAPIVDNSELQTQRATIVQEIDNIKSNLRNEDQIKAVDQRIAELEKEEKALSQQIADVEKTQFAIERFNKLKIDTLEAKINQKFKFVNFRMFETQINGGESECCDALIDGVPFSDANTASKINAGLDIINTLCEFYQVTAPIFIDNRESIIDVIDLNSQLINLIVSGEDKKLRVA